MAEPTAPATRAFHLIMRDAEEGSFYQNSETDSYFQLPLEILESLDAPLGDFAHEFATGVYEEGVRSDPDRFDVAPWFDVDELPVGSTVPLHLEDREALEAYLLTIYREAFYLN